MKLKIHRTPFLLLLTALFWLTGCTDTATPVDEPDVAEIRFDVQISSENEQIAVGRQFHQPYPDTDPPTRPQFGQHQPLGDQAVADLEMFFDDFFAAHLDAYQIPGAVVAVMVNGRLHLTKGYGYADLAGQRPVTPTTLFDVGSVSKLFTYTAVMQLVEQGRLDLHTDINQYLTRFQIPDTYLQPVTAAHLLTHTGGFDEWDIGAAARTQDEVLSVCDYLAQRLPPRVRPAGQLLVYANHGTALAGCLVEEISGQAFADYVAQHILAPLGMAQSSFGWPPELMAQMATGYELRPDGPHPYPIYYRHYGPAGELKTTAVDISRFMIAHLQNGRFEDAQILQPETVALMHRQQYSHDPRLPGFTYGFFEDELNGRRAILHGGDTTPTFSSLLLLLPEENVGLFIAHNTVDWHFRQQLVEAFMNRYFPAVIPPDPIQPLANLQREQYAGYYLPSLVQRNSNIEKVLGLFSQFRLTAEPDGTLTLHPGGDFAPVSRWVATAPDHFRQLDGEGVMLFHRDENGRIEHMFYSNAAAVAFTRLAWYQTAPFHLGLLLITLLVFVTAVVAWLLGYRRRQPVGRETALAGLIGLLNLLFVVGLFWVLQTRSFDLIFGATPLIYLISAIPLLALCLTVILLLLTVLGWRQQTGSATMRLHHSLFLLAVVAFFWFLNYWVLLGFNY
ncbi:MAG: serine hydrolase domain-containing protein [Chloroflexota bacterium]